MALQNSPQLTTKHLTDGRSIKGRLEGGREDGRKQGGREKIRERKGESEGERKGGRYEEGSSDQLN